MLEVRPRYRRGASSWLGVGVGVGLGVGLGLGLGLGLGVGLGLGLGLGVGLGLGLGLGSGLRLGRLLALALAHLDEDGRGHLAVVEAQPMHLHDDKGVDCLPMARPGGMSIRT